MRIQTFFVYFSFLFSLTWTVFADVFLHNPRGSNNRLNEKTALRKNNNRLFDSQNNNRGGYNVGDATDVPAEGDEKLQYQMKYFQSSSKADSELEIEWTMQHGCGQRQNHPSATPEVDCNIILQFMCQDSEAFTNSEDRIRDGVLTTSQGFTDDPQKTSEERKKNDVKMEFGLHENWFHYEKCHKRERNLGLFTADVNLKSGGDFSSAVHTRQNPNGERYGYECPEERDYFPYWHPSPWKDIAILVTNMTRCSYYQSNSFNVHPVHECIERNSQQYRIPSRWNNEKQCTENGGRWLQMHNYLEKAAKLQSKEVCEQKPPIKGMRYIWGIPYDSDSLMEECLITLPSPECKEAPWTRSNHLGITEEGRLPHYTWVLPYFPSNHNQTCIFRIRYNISSFDYDPETTDHLQNLNADLHKYPPVSKNPIITLGIRAPLRLAINTQQLGRTFQDRSHKFWLMARPETINFQRLYNLNVRGKRGNIVQAFPAIEYDFSPTVTKITAQDLIHIQWTGSNTHNNNGVGRDGQTGAAGIGAAGTDRSNFVEIGSLGENYPLPFEMSKFYKNADIKWIYFGKEKLSPLSLAVNLASSGFYRCVNFTECIEPEHLNFVYEVKEDKMNNVLNNVPASYPGVVLQLKPGTYFFMCTRNNKFSNRSQKGTLHVI